MKIGHQMINAGPPKTHLDEFLGELFSYAACVVYPGTRVMVTSGALSSLVTVMDDPGTMKCRGTVENSRLSDTPPKLGEKELLSELLTKAPSNFSKFLTEVHQETFNKYRLYEISTAYCHSKGFDSAPDCGFYQQVAAGRMRTRLRHPDGGKSDEWLATPRTDDRLNRCAIREWPDMVAIEKCWY